MQAAAQPRQAAAVTAAATATHLTEWATLFNPLISLMNSFDIFPLTYQLTTTTYYYYYNRRRRHWSPVSKSTT